MFGFVLFFKKFPGSVLLFLLGFFCLIFLMYFGALAKVSCTRVFFTTSLVIELSSMINIGLYPLLESLHSKNGKAS